MNNVAGFWMAGRDLENTSYTNPPIYKPAPKGFGITVGINGRRFYMDWDGYNVREKYPYLSDMTVHVVRATATCSSAANGPTCPCPRRRGSCSTSEGLAQGAIPPSDDGSTPDSKGLRIRRRHHRRVGRTHGGFRSKS